MEPFNTEISFEDRILVTGAGGFIGRQVVLNLLEKGFTKIRCLARPTPDSKRIHNLLGINSDDERIEVVYGNLLSPDDCNSISKDIKLIYHLAAGRGVKSFPDAFLNSVVTTRNLLYACVQHKCLKRLVNVSSFAVYSNRHKPQKRVLDETCPVDLNPVLRTDAYGFAKLKQEGILFDYHNRESIPYVNIRPGVVYGPGNEGIHGRVGIGTFGIFLHLGGLNKIPLTYVDNCAEAIVLAGIVPGIEGEDFNVVDDDLPSSRRFLHLYKKNVKHFSSIFVPHFLSYLLCYSWEKFSSWSHGQLPMSFSRKDWHAAWKKTNYSNKKLKDRLGWQQRIPTNEGLNRHFESCKEKLNYA